MTSPRGRRAPRESATGELLTAAREHSGASQPEVARAACVSRDVVANLELGRSSLPGHLMLDVASAYGVSVADLAEALREDFGA